jgi:hypothetical protein
MAKMIGKTKIIFVIVTAMVVDCIVFGLFVNAHLRTVYAEEIASPVETKDPKTQEMIDSIKKAGLSLHPAQYYEAW